MERDDAHPRSTCQLIGESKDLFRAGKPVAPDSPNESDSPSEILTGKPVELVESCQVLSTKNKTVWVVHSGQDHGDVRLLREHDYHVLHHERWFGFGDAHKHHHRRRRLKRDKPDLAHLYGTGPEERAA